LSRTETTRPTSIRLKFVGASWKKRFSYSHHPKSKNIEFSIHKGWKATSLSEYWKKVFFWKNWNILT
jgi:hypothetical protein